MSKSEKVHIFIMFLLITFLVPLKKIFQLIQTPHKIQRFLIPILNILIKKDLLLLALF
jgi:hypothetical protein